MTDKVVVVATPPDFQGYENTVNGQTVTALARVPVDEKGTPNTGLPLPPYAWTPTLYSAGAVLPTAAVGRVIAATAELTNFLPLADRTRWLHSLRAFDAAKRGVDIDIVLLKANVSIGSAGGVFSIADADLPQLIEVIPLVTGMWRDTTGGYYAKVNKLDTEIYSASGSRSIYAGVVYRNVNSITWGASDLSFAFGTR